MILYKIVLLLLFLCETGSCANLPPVFTKDMNNLAISENTKVGQVVYTLKGYDPEELPVTFGLIGTENFSVDPVKGDVTLIEPLDREKNDTLKFFVSIEDIVENSYNNVVKVPVSIIILDENDNAPEFKNSPYEIDVLENTVIGTTILKGILVDDKDSIGETLEVSCVASKQWSDACDIFEIVTLSSTQSVFNGSLILKLPLNYNVKHSYQFQLNAFDGILNSSTGVEVRIVDVQNIPPIFIGSLAAVLNEDAPIGTLVLTLQAKDGDRAHPRTVTYDLITNPHDYFLLDSGTGELRTGKPLDREILSDVSVPLNLTVRAREVINGQPVGDNDSTTSAIVTITIKDVNDEPPRFNRKEYFVEIPENMPFGTPLPNLDMLVTDTDIGMNSVFSLRLSDVSGAFIVEPQQATGSTQVNIRLNNYTLDYENPNQRKFIILVIAEELYTKPRLSSTATITITVTDVNDNAPSFKQTSYNAIISEQALPGTHILTIRATDRDHGRYGTEGIIYELLGNDAHLFAVDNRTGVIAVAPCSTPGEFPCLDYETSYNYFLNFKATDEDGLGQSTVVPLKISLYDTNDNVPEFLSETYTSSVDEGAVKFDPDLQVKAKDLDKTSVITYTIIEGPNSDLFTIDIVSGKVGILDKEGLNMINVKSDHVILTIQASDGLYNATCHVEINIRDVNNNPPIFEHNYYNTSVAEDLAIGTEVIKVIADDMDTGINSEIVYSIQNGAFDDFTITKDTGVVKIASKLDYDRKKNYNMQIIAFDQGIPVLTGTTFLTVTVLNVNDKLPYFTPQTQRTEVSVGTELGTIIHKLIAQDPDVTSFDNLKYEMGSGPITGVDRNGKQVIETKIFRHWFDIERNGNVRIKQHLDRNLVAVISLPVNVYDTSAPNLQMAQGTLIITIIGVNYSPPTFRQAYFLERLAEEQPVNTTLITLHAFDNDSSISRYVIDPPNQYFHINDATGVIKTSQRIDYESIHQINFTVLAFDSGIPILSTSVEVSVSIVNINDEQPIFDETMYEAILEENSPSGVLVLTIHASDKDEGVFGEIRYGISGDNIEYFTMDAITGELRVASGVIIDRETTEDIWLQAMAVDNAPITARKTANVQVHVKVKDMNDNPPVFGQRRYKASVAENLSLHPPAPILQVRAEDKDIGINGRIKYVILEQTKEGAFYIDSTTGILYPSSSLHGNESHHLKISAVDQLGLGPNSDTAFVDIFVESINQHNPVWIFPIENQTVLNISENTAQIDILLMTIKASDQDSGENGRVSYFIKVGNKNVHETNEFYLNEITGELLTRVFLDREQKDSYQLVLVAIDHGVPPREIIKFLTIVLNDSNDNRPIFSKDLYEYSIYENQPLGTVIGTVKAVDNDSGSNGKIFYYIIGGNENSTFSIEKTQGSIRTNGLVDREKKGEYLLTIYASNEPLLDLKYTYHISTSEMLVFKNSSDINEENKSITHVSVIILDENDNAPYFEKLIYYAGIKSSTKVNEPVLLVKAVDPDSDVNSAVNYLIIASNLYKYGSVNSSGSIVPSPFNITQEGLIITTVFMAEYNQDRFLLNIVAQERQPPYRQAKADIYVWIVKPEQLVRVVFSKSCLQVNNKQSIVTSRLSNATNTIIVVNALKNYIQPDYKDRCDVHMHMVNPVTYVVLPVDEAIAVIDSQYDQLRDLYDDSGIDIVMPADKMDTYNAEFFDPALAAIIALLIVLFTGIVTFIVVCSCLKQWILPLSSDNIKEKGSMRERGRRLLQELSSTDNPLWAEHKLRLYEEQELTMNVFGENNDGYSQQRDLTIVDNTYATIRNSEDRDYATLNVPHGSSQVNTTRPCNDNMLELSGTAFGSIFGFQGSTFQPEVPSTPDPPPRSNNM